MKNIYTVLEEIEYEKKCKRAKHLISKDRFIPEQFIFAIIQQFYENIDDDYSEEINQLRTENRELVEALKKTLKTINNEDTAIVDTIWVSEYETLVEYIQNIPKKHGVDPYDK